MARTDSLGNFLTDVANSIRTKTGKTDKIPAGSFDTEISSITTSGEPVLLQDKTVEITENGTTNIVADEGYDGLRNVEVITNVSLVPEKGFAVTGWDEDGYVTDVIVKNMNIPNYGFRSESFFGKVVNVNIVGDITAIGSNAFYNNNSLSEINLPDTITTIGDYAFEGCTNLKLEKLPDSLTTFGEMYGSEFKNCSKITINKIPQGVARLNSQSFAGCTSIEEIDLNNVWQLGGSNFQNCTRLKTVKGLKVSSMNNALHFYNCTSLKKVNLPLITTIDNVFNNCTSLPSICLPNINAIYNGGFYRCTSLKAVWIGDSITSRGFYKNAFSSCPNIKKIFINLPRETVETFTNYSYVFSNNTLTTDVIICNDDEGFMTQEEFDAIDWENYTE